MSAVSNRYSPTELYNFFLTHNELHTDKPILIYPVDEMDESMRDCIDRMRQACKESDRSKRMENTRCELVKIFNNTLLLQGKRFVELSTEGDLLISVNSESKAIELRSDKPIKIVVKKTRVVTTFKELFDRMNKFDAPLVLDHNQDIFIYGMSQSELDGCFVRGDDRGIEQLMSKNAPKGTIPQCISDGNLDIQRSVVTTPTERLPALRFKSDQPITFRLRGILRDITQSVKA